MAGPDQPGAQDFAPPAGPIHVDPFAFCPGPSVYSPRASLGRAGPRLHTWPPTVPPVYCALAATCPIKPRYRRGHAPAGPAPGHSRRGGAAGRPRSGSGFGERTTPSKAKGRKGGRKGAKEPGAGRPPHASSPAVCLAYSRRSIEYLGLNVED
ncbi:PREDICTED: translation initiation factor IF-2-like isoform X2 [Chinchilla lanigera]|uniref:translation initiation factor IF-2-like isoform X2 n=1 Tax=Chinchilla lanigera TaxID=34839 RepID=UPI0006990738|nr:PREDICTED: translation initiation factor IF-2-like isoform X2 [Chinchilla lanigera]